MSGALRRLGTTLTSIWTWSVLGLGIAVTCPFIVGWRLIGWPFDRANYLGGRLFRLVGVLTVKLTPRWHFSVQGVPPADPRHPYVVVSNHESFADMLLLCHLPWEMKWLSKREITWIPVLGWSMWGARDVGVRRGMARSAKRAMADCEDRLSRHVSVIIFPEGTRAPGEDLLPFKDGAFRLAIDAGVPILPVVVAGTRNAIARHDWRINPARAVVEILAPEPVDGVTDTRVLRDRVRARIAEARERLRHQLEPA